MCLVLVFTGGVVLGTGGVFCRGRRPHLYVIIAIVVAVVMGDGGCGGDGGRDFCLMVW